MFAKSTQSKSIEYKNINSKKPQRAGLIWVFLFLFMSIQTAYANLTKKHMSIPEYNKMAHEQKQKKYKEFETAWFEYLKSGNKSLINFEELTPAITREATENYLIKQGGVIAKLGHASSLRETAFTFKRPIDDPDRKASFHRIYRSIFMDIPHMNSNEWLLIFVHEVAHSLDSVLYDSITKFNDENYFKSLHQMKNIYLKDLDQQSREQLDAWLMAGLNLGFLSEYRAWVVTYYVYEEGLQKKNFHTSGLD